MSGRGSCAATPPGSIAWTDRVAAHAVCRLEELPPGGRKLVRVKGRDVALFNIKGELFAVLDRCPHAGASLVHGQLTGLMCSSAPGTYELVREGEILRCPWHRWEFDLRTGKSCAEPNRLGLKTYEVAITEANEVPQGDIREAQTLEATVFPVSVDGSWVVIDA